MTAIEKDEPISVTLNLLLTGYVLGAIPWGLFELVIWMQPGTPYKLSDVLFFTLIWPLRFLMWAVMG